MSPVEEFVRIFLMLSNNDNPMSKPHIQRVIVHHTQTWQ
jgi:hypothetical protein